MHLLGYFDSKKKAEPFRFNIIVDLEEFLDGHSFNFINSNRNIEDLYVFYQSPRFKNFDSSRNSLNPTLRPDLRPNSDDSLCHVIDSCKIFGSSLGVRPNENKTDLGWF